MLGDKLVNFPVVLSFFSVVALWLSAQIGASLRRRWGLRDNIRSDFAVVQTVMLTFLGLIIGFSFSMAVSRYDLRKNYEAAEANAIETEYVRAGLLPAADAEGVRTELKKYLDLRILFYTTVDARKLDQINADTVRAQAAMWSAVRGPATAQPSPMTALAVSGMNDVLNSEAYTQAAWWNRIPAAAWGLILALAIFGNMLLGFGASDATAKTPLLLVVPLIVSIAVLLIADIDSPGGGLIRVTPQSLVNLPQSLPNDRSRK